MDVGKKQKSIILKKGFTLIEMIVVLAIVGVISAIAMFNYSDFRQGIDTRNVAQEIALSIRKAQSYATSSKGITDKNGDRIKTFGMVFSINTMKDSGYAPYTKGFVLYAGLPVQYAGVPASQYAYSFFNKNRCDGGRTSIWFGTQCLEYFSMTTPVSITKLEVLDTNGNWVDISSGANELQFLFFRPTADATICVTSGFTNIDCAGKSAGRITIASQNNKIQKSITVWSTGQIAVENVVVQPSGIVCYPGDPRIECAEEIGGGLKDPIGGGEGFKGFSGKK